MKNFLSMAALALVGAVMTGCSGDDNSIISNPQQPENTSNVVTLTTTVGFDGGAATTRALTAGGVKTFAAGDQIAVIYTKNGGTVTKAVSVALQNNGDITNSGKSATFTVTLDNPDKTQNVTYIYPAAMAGETDVDYTKLNSQEGTLDDLGSKYDLCTNSGAWNAGALPSLILNNRLAILACTLKNNATPTANEITSTITGMTVSDGTNTYTVTRSAAAGPIYVAIRPTTSATINITATAGATNYVKTLTDPKTYAAGNGYSVSWRMARAIMAAAATAADKGKLICTAGHIHAYNTDAECRAARVALITYVGNDAETNTTYNHGLALALKDASTTATWCTQTSNTCLTKRYSSESGKLYDMAGIANTDYLITNAPVGHTHSAASEARNYKYDNSVDAGTPPIGTSAWFLPSAGQWDKMDTAAGGSTNLCDGFSSVGGTNMLADKDYWSSTENEALRAEGIKFSNCEWGGIVKTAEDYVRACLAF